MKGLQAFHAMAVLSLVASACLLIGLVAISKRIDADQHRREAQLISLQVENMLSAARSSLSAAAKSDAAVINLDHVQNEPWARLAFASIEAQSVWYYTADWQNRVVSGLHVPSTATKPFELALPIWLKTLNAKRRSEPSTSVLWWGKRPYLFTLAQISPETEKVRLWHDRPPLLIAITPLDQFLRPFFAGTGVRDLAVAHRTPSASEKGLADLNRREVAALTWTPATPGADLRRIMLPPLLALVMLMLTLVAVAYQSAMAASRSLKQTLVDAEIAQARAEHLAQAKSEFLANMSHEIRTPLNGVVAVADMLASSDLPPRERGMAELIRASGDTLQRLLSDILDMARIESGKITIELAPFHAGDMVRAVAGLSQLKCDERGVRLLVEIAPEIDGVVEGDMVRVRQVVTNLLSNAVKFTDHGEVKLFVERLPDGRARFTVADTGVGFAMIDKAKVLGRFEQADSSITRRFGGSGLGLSICCNLAELMGGTLDCESQPGVGSHFWLELPLEPAAAALAPELAFDAGDQAGEGAPLRVLAADDHPTNRQVVKLMLDEMADLTCVDDGMQALEAFDQGRYDIVLMDMQMPRMDGLTALRAIRRREAERGLARTPVVMLTANALPEHVASAIAAGANLHLSKPFTAAGLFEALEEALSSHEREQAAA